MKRIHYYQDIYEHDEQGEPTAPRRVYLTVDSSNDKDFQEQLQAVKSYCGEDYTVEELSDIAPEPSPLQLRADVDYIAIMTGVDLDV